MINEEDYNTFGKLLGSQVEQIINITAERDALKAANDELVEALEGIE